MAETQARLKHRAAAANPAAPKHREKTAKPGAKRASTAHRSAPAKHARKRRKGILQRIRESWFYRIYFALLALCAVGLVAGLIVLSGVLAEYEETRPIHRAEAVLELFEQRDWAQIEAIDESAKKFRYDAPEQYALQMDELSRDAEFRLKTIVTVDEREQKYNVMLNDLKFAELTLEHSGETTAHNFERWQLKSLETQALSPKTYTITVPSDSAVEVNGLALGEADVLERDLPAIDSANLPEGVAAPTYTKYGVYMLASAPEGIRVTDRNGEVCAPTDDGAGNYSCPLSWDDARIKEQCEDAVVKWGRRIAAYTSNDYDMFTLSNACVNPSPARTYIRNMQNQWAARHSGYNFENIETRNYYVYSDDCFSCEISFDYIVHYTARDRSYPTKYTLYFVKSGGTFKLYSFTMD